MPVAEKYSHTTEEIYALPEGKRAELIDGQIYDMAPPGRIHQELVQQLSRTIGNYIADHKGTCKVYPAPFAVFLNQDDKTYVEPDISVICDNGKLDDRGCNGAPDWVIEIVSQSSQRMDYLTKLFKYRTAGVRELISPSSSSAFLAICPDSFITSAVSFMDFTWLVESSIIVPMEIMDSVAP